MRKVFSVFCAFLIAGLYSLNAQSSILEEGERIVEAESQDRLIFELTHDNWSFDSDDELVFVDDYSTRWYSRGISLYFMYDVVFGNSNFSFAPGLGFQSTNVFHNGRLIVNDSTGYTEFHELGDLEDFRKNKLNITYIDIPLELRFRTRPNARGSSFKIGLGFKGGIRVDSKTKIKHAVDGDMKVFKEKRLANLNRFRYGPTFRIGYGVFNVVAYYSLTEVFEDGRGPSLIPFSVGISLNGL